MIKLTLTLKMTTAQVVETSLITVRIVQSYSGLLTSIIMLNLLMIIVMIMVCYDGD